jgi:hypothetical protein
MSEFSDLFRELRTILDDPDAYYEQIGPELDPNLVDKLHAYAAARNIPLQQAILNALQLFMLSSAEDAWRKLSASAGSRQVSRQDPEAAPLNIILDRFLAIALDPARQKTIEGREMPAILNQFRRVAE